MSPKPPLRTTQILRIKGKERGPWNVRYAAGVEREAQLRLMIIDWILSRAEVLESNPLSVAQSFESHSLGFCLLRAR